MRPLTLDVVGAFGALLHRPRRRRCVASGWDVRSACAEHGRMICPVCVQPVRAREDHARPGAVRIGGHGS